MIRTLRFAVRLSVAVLLISLLSVPLFGDADDPPGRAARLSVVQGNVSLLPSGASDWSQATLNYPLTAGDRVYTDNQARVELEIGNVAVRCSEATDLTVANLSDNLLQLGIGQGTINLAVYEIVPGNTIEVDTPNGALTIEQPGAYRVEAYPNDAGSFVSVERGALEITGGGVSEQVSSRQAVKLTGTDQITAQFVDMPPADDFDRWCADRDRRFEAAASARYVGREVPGYYELDGYGRWDPNSEYGPVWYPTVAVGWAPYRVGHWAWVSPWGWTWIDDAPWGFSPFHYGRWVMIGPAWAWVPGPVVARPVYAPALVAFIGGPHFGISIGIGAGVGWFPLGPREPFIPWYHHSDTYIREVNVTNVRNIEITNITNVRNVTYVNQRVATTVVSSDTFRNGSAVHQHLMAVNPNEVVRAQVIAHPEVNPAPRAIGTGRPAVNPPHLAPLQTVPHTEQRPMQVNRTPQAAPGPARPVAPTGEYNRPSATPPNDYNRPSAPPPNISRPAPAPGNPPAQTGTWRTFSRPGPAAQGPAPRVVTRTPPPPPEVPYSQRQPAMQEHPGRPLEPQQMENLRQGRAAGPMQDREELPHSSPPPKPQSRPAPERDRQKH